MPKLVHLSSIINPENNKEIENAIQILSLKINIKTDKEILFGNEEHLISKTGIDRNLFNVIKKRLIDYYSCEMVNGDDLFNDYLTEGNDTINIFYSFGNKKIDQLINGGMKPGEIIELVGSPSTGKTQLCFQLSLNVLLSNINNTVLYLDTRGSFSMKRIIDFYYSDNNLKRKNSEDIKDLISRIKHQGVYSYNELFSILEKITIERNNTETMDNEFCKNLKLIVINSISSLIFPIMSNNDYTRNSVMSSIANYLTALSRKYNISILITNFTVGATSYNNLLSNPSGSLEYYNKKMEFYDRQKAHNVQMKNILQQHQYPLQNHNGLQNTPLTKNQTEELTCIINKLNDDFPQCLEINKTISNSVIRDGKKPSLGNVWTYTPDIQLFLTSHSSPDPSQSENNQNYANNNINNNESYNTSSDKSMHNNKRQKLNNYYDIKFNEVTKKIEVVLSHRTCIGQSCFFSINENGIY